MSYVTTTACPNPCSGIHQLGFWCDSPCDIGKGSGAFVCECELKPGAIAGIVIGSVFGFVALVTCISLLCLWRCRARQRRQMIDGATVNPDYQQHLNQHYQPQPYSLAAAAQSPTTIHQVHYVQADGSIVQSYGGAGVPPPPLPHQQQYYQQQQGPYGYAPHPPPPPPAEGYPVGGMPMGYASAPPPPPPTQTSPQYSYGMPSQQQQQQNTSATLAPTTTNGMYTYQPNEQATMPYTAAPQAGGGKAV